MRQRQTKGAATDMFSLQPLRHTSTLPRAVLQRALLPPDPWLRPLLFTSLEGWTFAVRCLKKFRRRRPQRLGTHRGSRWRLPERPVKVPLARWFAKSHSIIDKLCDYMLFFAISRDQNSRDRFIACRRAPRRQVLYQSTAGHSACTRAYPLFLRPPCRVNSRISAARPVS